MTLEYMFLTQFQVNGQDMTNMQHKEAVVFLRQTPQTVTLVFERQVENDSDVTPTPSPRVPHNSNIQVCFFPPVMSHTQVD